MIISISYSRFIGQGFDKIAGFQMYFALLTVLVVILIVSASINSWSTMTIWQWAVWLKILFIVFPLMLIAALIATMRRMDAVALMKIKIIVGKDYPFIN